MFKLSLLFFLIGLSLSQVKAIPAYPRKVLMKINGKDTLVKICGDEHSKHIENEEGYTIVQDDKGDWYYALLDGLGRLTPSVNYVGVNSDKLREFMSLTPLHLSESASPTNRSKSHQTNRQPVTGQRRVLIILMEFPDKRFIKTEHDFDNLFNQVDYSEDGAQGSVRDYFYRSSYGQLVLSCDIYGPYLATNRMSTYGMNSILGGGDKSPEALFEEAIVKVSSEIDLSAYDGDNDGYIDNVHIIYAGYGEEAGGPSNAIWAHEATFSRPYEIQGLKIDRYSCASELRGNSGEGISRIGPHCHEIGHALGAMDFYDTNYSDGGLFEGTGVWDLMAAGSWNNDGITPADFNPFVKSFCFGWANARMLPEGSVVIAPSDIDGDNYYIVSHGKEHYLLENRNPRQYNEGLPGKGLLLYHVHYDIEESESRNEINTTAPQMCYVVCASANKDIPKGSSNDYGNINSEGCPFPGSSNKKEFSMTSIPAAFWWNNDDCGISLHDIQLSGDGNIQLFNDSQNIEPESKISSEVYFDGFETQRDYMILSSSQSSWERVKSSGLVDMVSGRPIAYEGDYCMQLSARDSKNSSMSSLGFKTHIADEATTVMLSGLFISKGLNKQQVNQLRIGWRTGEKDSWTYYDYDVPVNDVWTPFVLKLSPSSDMEFSIEGTAQSGSVLAIDNLRVEKQIMTDIRESRLIKVSATEYFSISGKKKTQLSKGLNIVIERDGTTKKVYVK